jgi:acyl-CoA synthetase (NDP forming)
MPEHKGYEFFRQLGVETMPGKFIGKGEGSRASKGLKDDTSYVAKAVVAGVSHKTDVGGIKFHVDKGTADGAFRELEAKFKEGFEGVLFVEELRYERRFGSELIIGMYQDAFFGPCVLFGLGGVLTEAYKDMMEEGRADVSIPAYVDAEAVKEIISSTVAVQAIEGKLRGGNAIGTIDDIVGIIGKLQSVGRYYSKANRSAPFVLSELEMNPAVFHDGKIVALDAVVQVVRNDGAGVDERSCEKIERLLEPKSVAIAGASGKNPANPSNSILKKFLKAGLSKDAIYLIHPGESEIEGVPCKKSIEEVMRARGGKPVDCFIVGVPARIAAPLILDSFERNFAEAIQIISAGFGETKSGREIEEGIKSKLRLLPPAKRPVVNGPNTLGNIHYDAKTLFTPGYKSSFSGVGMRNSAVICQSGAYMITRISDMAGAVAPPIAISVGNQMDLSVADFLEYVLKDDKIDCIGMYVEGLIEYDGLKLMRLISKAKADGKDVVIYKAGRTRAGMEAAAGHTAAMAGDYDMFAAFMRMAGAIVVDGPREFDDMMMISCMCADAGLRGFSKRVINVAALSNAGFEKCLIADHMTLGSSERVQFAKYSKATEAKIMEALSKAGVLSIVDQGRVLDLSPMMNDAGFEAIIRATLEDDGVDFGIYCMVPETAMLNTCIKSDRHREDVDRDDSILMRLIRIRGEYKKPFAVSIESGRQYDFFAGRLMAAGIPAFRSADEAANAVAKYLG